MENRKSLNSNFYKISEIVCFSEFWKKVRLQKEHTFRYLFFLEFFFKILKIIFLLQGISFFSKFNFETLILFEHIISIPVYLLWYFDF